MKGYFLSDYKGFEEKELQVGKLRLAFPALDPAQVHALSAQLLVNQEKLAAEPIEGIIDWIVQAAARWSDPDDLIREEAEWVMPLLSGISREMLHIALDDLLNQLRRPMLLKLLEEALGDVRRLDQFCPRTSALADSRAFGPRLITQIFPANIPGLSITGLVLGLLTKSANLIRMSKEEALLPTLFARSLQDIRPDLAGNIAILHWDRSEEALTKAAFQKAGAVIVYGNDDTITKLRKLIPPTSRSLFYGHKLSLGLIARESINEDIAEKAARDVALYEQRGCLSPHLFYIEAGGSATPLDFAQWLAVALESLSARLPKAALSPNEAAQIQQLRAALPLKGGTVFSSPKNLDWTVLYDPDPGFTLSPLSRTIWIKPVEDLSGVPSLLLPYRDHLQAVGLALTKARQNDLTAQIAELGGCRICQIGQMQQPPLTWHHDGQSPLLPLLRFVDREPL